MENIDKQPDQSKAPTPEPVPEIPDSEMKLPDEQFGHGDAPEAPKDHIVSPWLVVALIIVLVVLGGVIVWGDALVKMLAPLQQADTTMEGDAMTSEKSQPEEVVTEEDITAMEAELEAEVNLDDLDNDLDSIDAELDSAL